MWPRVFMLAALVSLSACTELRPADEVFDSGSPPIEDGGGDGGTTPSDGGPASLSAGQLTTTGTISSPGNIKLRAHGFEALERSCSANSELCVQGSIGP